MRSGHRPRRLSLPVTHPWISGRRDKNLPSLFPPLVRLIRSSLIPLVLPPYGARSTRLCHLPLFPCPSGVALLGLVTREGGGDVLWHRCLSLGCAPVCPCTGGPPLPVPL